MSVIDKLRKRRKYPIEIDGETINIRALRDSEIDTVTEFQNDDESIGFAIGYGVLNDDGTPAFSPLDGESPKEFGGRVLDEIDMPSDTKAEISEKIMKLSKGPLKPDDLKKN
jgi:hypothetical protein